MANLKSAFSQGLFQSSTTQREALGTKRMEADGRVFRYAKAGGALAAGKAAIKAVDVDNHINLPIPAAYAIGSKQITITVGATAVTADQYKDGFLQVNDATGEGYQYRIESNTACDASGSTIVQLADPIAVALVASTSEVSLIPNEYSGITHSATEENAPAGVAVCAIASGSYGWVQTAGPALALMAGTPAVGSMLTLGSVAGSLAAINATLDIDQPYFAQKTLNAGVNTEYKPVHLFID